MSLKCIVAAVCVCAALAAPGQHCLLQINALAAKQAAAAEQPTAGSTPPGMNKASCQTICQRFGMQMIAKQFKEIGQTALADAFAAMSSPVPCAEKCDEVFSAVAAGSPPDASEQPLQAAGLTPWKLVLDGLFGFAAWMVLALVVVSCCYIRGYVPNAPPVGTPEETFSTGHFGCFSDCQICCCSLLCPGIRWADTMAQAKLLDFWTAFAAFLALAMLNVATSSLYTCGAFTLCLCVYFRQELRRKLKLPAWALPTVALDCVYIFFCSCCAIAQEAMVVRQAIQHMREDFEPPEPERMENAGDAGAS